MNADTPAGMMMKFASETTKPFVDDFLLSVSYTHLDVYKRQLEYLAVLPEKITTTANVEKYIKIIEEKSILRNLIKTANDIISAGYDQTEEVEDIMNIACLLYTS